MSKKSKRERQSRQERPSPKRTDVWIAAGLTVRMAIFPDGEDPDSLRIKKGKEAVAQAIAGGTRPKPKINPDKTLPNNFINYPFFKRK